jgi:hypothetical protein
MSDNGPAPKPLWQVLEEEFVALGGILPKEYEAARKALVDARSRQTDRATSSADCVEDDLAQQARENEALLPSLYGCMHARATNGAPRSALCFSGGGIRSATFNLGMLQVLARANLLRRFDYLSTVSGGGYLGGWLTSWIGRNPQGLDGVTRALAGPDAAIAPPAAAGANAEPSVGASPLNPEPAPLHHLRTYSRYLSPTLGLMSADTWTLVTIYLRNLTLNWLVLVPLLAAALMIPRLCAAIVAVDPVWRGVQFLGIDPRHMSTLAGLLRFAGMALAAWAFGYAGLHQPSVRTARRATTSACADLPTATRRSPPGSAGQISFLRGCWLPLVLSAVCLSTFWAWSGDLRVHTWPCHVGFGMALGVIGWTVFATKHGELARLWEIPWILLAGAATGLALWGSAHVLDAIAPKPDPWDAWSNVGIYYATVVCLGLPLILASFSLGGTLYVGFVSRLSSTHDEDREWWARCGAWVLIAIMVWLLTSGLVLFGPGLLQRGIHWMAALSLGGLTSAATVLLGRSAATPGTRAGRNTNDRTQRVTRAIMTLIAPISIVLIVVAVSAGTSVVLFTTWVRVAPAAAVARLFPDLAGTSNGFWLDQLPSYFRMLYVPAPGMVAVWIAGLIGFGLGMARLIHLNKFSMHGMYRDRLVRAYLGASRVNRAPDPFTGFDPMDDVTMYKLRPELLSAAHLTQDGSFFRRLVSVATGAPAAADPVSAYLVSHLKTDVRAPLALAKAHELSEGQRSNVLDDLNRLVLEKDFAAASAFAGALAGALATAIAAGQSAQRLRQDVPLHNRLLLHAAYVDDIRPPSPRQIATSAPLHVVNVALNLVSGDDPAWQERKAECFTVSPMHSGSSQLGYRDSRTYGGRRGISLGTAVTISGAAVSPNMGYHSSKPIAFLLTLFNVRLGWWLGNPGQAGEQTFTRSCPNYAVAPLFAEAFGLTDRRHHYVYLSDGGHFENLGLYEMVRRRCHVIILGDGGCDRECSFADLGNAVRKIRIDMGVPITFDGAIPIFPRRDEPRKDGQYCAIGTIHYSAIDGEDALDGVLLYVKPAFYGTEPADVFNYAQGCKDFPHETTADQFFSESQFESYRALGCHVMQQVLSSPAVSSRKLEQVLQCAGPQGVPAPVAAVLGSGAATAPRKDGEVTASPLPDAGA